MFINAQPKKDISHSVKLYFTMSCGLCGLSAGVCYSLLWFARHFPFTVSISLLWWHAVTYTQTPKYTQKSNILGLLCLTRFLSPSLTYAHARSHQRIGLDYNLICSGRDGIEHQIIPNEENQSPRVQISWKLVNSDWFRRSSRQGGIWQITVSQVDRKEGRE